MILLLLLLCGCTGHREELDRAMTLRAKLLGCLGCSFRMDVTADYGDAYQSFSMDCTSDNKGAVRFTVTAPESIYGITGVIDGEGGKLTFDDVALSFPLLADDQLTPASAPWILMKTLLGGYLTACNTENELLHIMIDDSYEEDALQMQIWLDEDGPVQAECYYDGRRILTMQITDFKIS